MPFRSILIKIGEKHGCCKCESQAQVCQGVRDGTPQTQKPDRRKDLLKRLNRIEGQVRGVEGDGGRRAILRRYIKPGISGSGGAEQFSKVLLSNHQNLWVDDIEAEMGKKRLRSCARRFRS